jgi:acyl-CoA reductase-like NAD-dependent aldehyde dehydrogenase
VLTGVTDDMAIAQEEIFGPAAPLLVFDTEEEVIRAKPRSSGSRPTSTRAT